MKTQYFNSDSYTTSKDNNGGILRSKCRRSRLRFTTKFLGEVFRSRRIALDGKYDLNEWTRASVYIMNLLEESGAVFTIKGFENIRNLKEPVVFVGNHMSTLETMVFPGLIAPLVDVTFVVKDSLVTNKVFGPIMRARDPIVVSRNNSRNDLTIVMDRGSELLKMGTSVIIFPQSTRKSYFSVKEFNTLGVKLAARNKVRVIPVAIKTDYWKNGKLVKDLGPLDRNQAVNIDFGEPLEVIGNGKQAHQAVLDFVLERLRKWNVEIRE